MYLPVFLQGVQGISTTRSGLIITPYSVLMAFIGVPVGFLLARTGSFKWMYVLGFGLLTADMFSLVLFTTETPVLGSVAACMLAGLGLGAIPTVNTTVVQNSVPKRLIGVAMGAIFFFILMGVAMSPAILGSAMNASYATTLAKTLPPELHRIAGEAAMTSLGNPRVLLSPASMAELEKTIRLNGGDGRLFEQTVTAIRGSMLAGLKSVFWIGSITMLMALGLISTIPAKSESVEEQQARLPAEASNPA